MEATQFDVIIETLKLSEVDVETMKARKKGLDKDIKVSATLDKLAACSKRPENAKLSREINCCAPVMPENLRVCLAFLQVSPKIWIHKSKSRPSTMLC